MKVEVLQDTTFIKDTSGNPLGVGDVGDVDPSFGGTWVCLGLVRVLEHDEPAGPDCVMVRSEPLSEPDADLADGHIYKNDASGNRVRDYLAERRQRKSETKTATKSKKDKLTYDNDQG